MWPLDGDMSSAIEIGVKEGNVYRLMGNSIQAQVHVVMNPCELWHRRFGHLNYRALPSFPDMVTGMPPIKLIHDGMCNGCALGKHVKKPYSSSSRRSKGILDLIHSDICGPMTVPSMSGCLYYVIFIDDYSRKSWIYFMKAKSETFAKFQEFKTFIEKQTGLHIRALRSNNGGEFDSHHFNDLCRETRIKRALIVPYKPQQNGVAERKNRTICEAAKAMMHDLDLPTSIWAEVVGTAVYVQNKCLHFILGDKTLEEKFTGVKPTVVLKLGLPDSY
jgi:hypothetical protein